MSKIKNSELLAAFPHKNDFFVDKNLQYTISSCLTKQFFANQSTLFKKIWI